MAKSGRCEDDKYLLLQLWIGPFSQRKENNARRRDRRHGEHEHGARRLLVSHVRVALTCDTYGRSADLSVSPDDKGPPAYLKQFLHEVRPRIAEGRAKADELIAKFGW